MGNNFKRTDSLFSLCGLSCGLCPMHIRGNCGGCFTDSPCYPACPIAPCSVRHGNVEYCFECKEYPCKRYDGIDLHDSLISHRNQKKDLAKAKQIGIEAYQAEQREKRTILSHLLMNYNDGRQDVFYCLAVNMLSLDDLQKITEQADRDSSEKLLSEKITLMRHLLYACAQRQNILLELRP